MNDQKLPADSSSLILGIVALVIVLLGCCCGFLSVVAFILSIVGLVQANKSLKEFKLHPETYSAKSRSNVSTAKILNIVALILSAVTTLFYLAYFLLYGAFISSAIYEGYKNDQNYGDYELEEYNDSIDWEEGWKDYEPETIEVDSLFIDSIQVEETQEN